MKYITLFGASFVFVVLRHFSSQRHKQETLQQLQESARRAQLEQDLIAGYREQRYGEEIWK